MNNLSFSAQHLDNQSLDPMKIGKYFLTEEKMDERQKLAEKISEVSLKGEEVFFKNSHFAFLYHDKFLLETPSDQLDDGGRIAPLLCYGQVPDEPRESWSVEVVESLVVFAKSIKRTVSDESQRVALEGVQKIVEESKRWRRRKVEKILKPLGLGAAAIAVLAWVMKGKRGKDKEIDKEMGRRNQNLALGIIAILSLSNAILAAVILSKK